MIISEMNLLNNYMSEIAISFVHCIGSLSNNDRNKREDGTYYSYLEKLIYAIETTDKIKSFSTIREGDFRKFGEVENYTGDIGIIAKPTCSDSIIYANYKDGGTLEGCPTNSPKPTYNEIVEVIENRPNNRYNEFCIYNYKPLGIFFKNFDLFTNSLNLPSFNKNDIYTETKHLNLPYFLLNNGVFTKIEMMVE